MSSADASPEAPVDVLPDIPFSAALFLNRQCRLRRRGPRVSVFDAGLMGAET